MTVEYGGTFTGGGATLGAGSNTTATLNVTRTGSDSYGSGPALVNLAGVMTVGYGGGSTGNLNISAGGIVNSNGGYVGSMVGPTTNSNGNVKVDGIGSQWNDSGSLSLGGNSGSYYGGLYITNGAAVTVGGTTKVGGASLEIVQAPFTSAMAERWLPRRFIPLRAKLWGSPAGLQPITTHGLVSDVAIVFDATHGPIQPISGFGNVVVNLNVSDPNKVGDLGGGLCLSSRRFADHQRRRQGLFRQRYFRRPSRFGGQRNGNRRLLEVVGLGPLHRPALTAPGSWPSPTAAC